MSVDAVATPTLLYEMSDVARYLGISYSGLYALVKKGGLEPFALTKRGLRLFKPADVFALKKKRDSARFSMRPR